MRMVSLKRQVEKNKWNKWYSGNYENIDLGIRRTEKRGFKKKLRKQALKSPLATKTQWIKYQGVSMELQ